LTVGTAVSLYAGIAKGGAGNDLFDMNGRAVSNATIGGNVGLDTITATATTTLSYLGGGKDADLITWTGGGSNTTVKAGMAADRITLSGAATTSTVLGNEGFDTISASALTGNTNVYIGGGKGGDRINVVGQVGSIVGGYLSDTITALGAFGGGVVYADANGEKIGGTGTGNTEDGNDVINFTAGTLAEGTTVYGADGADTISFAVSSAASAVLIDGGKGKDVIGNSAVLFFTAGIASTISGGNGADVIKFADARTGLILGGAGTDSIFATTYSGVASINGGSQNDTINFSNATILASTVNTATINGGAGADSIILSTYTAATSSRAGVISGNFLANIAGVDSGDVIRFNNTQGAAATANWLGQTQIYIGANAAAITTAVTSGVGSIAVYASGDDMVVAIKAGSNAQSAYVQFQVIGGATMIKTTATGAVTMNSSNFGFSVGSVSNAIGLTFA
jgi:TM2 domain-containing membrane protein YozV